MATASTDVDDIRRQMAKIRLDMHQDMQGVVAGAEAAADWRRYVRSYPWVFLAGAVTVGFLIVPRRRRSIREAAEAAATNVVEKVYSNGQGLAAAAPVELREKKKRPGIFRLALTFLGPIALRAAQGYASQYIENFVAQQTQYGPPPFGGMPPFASGKPPGNAGPTHGKTF